MKNILTKAFMLTFISLLSISVQAQMTCLDEQPNLSAQYTITATNTTGQQKHTELILWRLDNQVAHQYPQTEITELWQRVAGERIKPFRMFDHYQRTIEYQPGESVHGKTEKDWSHRYQLISDSLLAQMTITGESGDGCESTQTLTGTFGDVKMVVSWRPKLKLMESLTWQSPNGKETWQLQHVATNPKDVKDFFAQRHDYYATDFADIGDDHTDPFLTQMTNLGFIEHGASGFYEASKQGIKSSGGSHSHGHAH